MRLIRFRSRSAGSRIASLVALCLVLCAIGIAMLTINLRNGLTLQASASSDNTQWTFSQLDVEYANLYAAARIAESDGRGLRELRKRFDILYNRATILREGSLFAPLLQEPIYTAGIAAVNRFLTDYVPLIDGPDNALLAALPQMNRDLAILRAFVKAVVSSGIIAFAEHSDGQRLDFAQNLIRLGLLTAFMVSLLIVLTFVLLQLNKSNDERAQQLQASLARTATIVTAAIDAVVMIDADGYALEFNPAAEQMFGYRRDEVLGNSVGFLFDLTEDDRQSGGWIGFLQGCIAQKRNRSSARRRDGQLFPIELSVVEGRDPHGRIYVAYLRDLTVEVANAAALHQARDEARAGAKTKADLLTVMSHEMRTPLNGMMGMIELLGATPLGTDQRRFLAAMQNAGDILLHHVDDVLKIAKLESGTVALRYDWINLSDLVHEIFVNQAAPAARKFNRLEFQAPADAPALIYSDAFQLRQVLLNLIGNAIKFTQNGLVSVDVRLAPATGAVELLVADTGIGISAENREKVFDDFVTLDASYARNTGGTGLGLGITRRIVAALGGTVACEGNPGGGTVFRVTLPQSLPQRDKGPTASEPLAQPRPSAPKAPLNILVAEDNPINRLLLRELIAKLGHTVTEAHDGAEAVQIAISARFDVIFMDISMPNVDGIRAAQMIRYGGGPNHATPIVALTAHAMAKDRDRIIAAGMQDILIKPIQGHVLAALIAKTLPASLPHILSAKLIEEMRSLLGPDRLAHTLNSFVAEATGTLHRTPPDPTPETYSALHRLNGAAAMLGAEDLSTALRRLQDALETDDAETFHRLWPEALAIWHATEQAINTVMQDIT